MVIDDDNSVFTIKDSSFKTGKSTLCIKASATIIDIDNTTMEPGQRHHRPSSWTRTSRA